ncbi:MAG: LysM peptidoglycan-binding domain-containing protein [Kineosporiaceae bacterium]|nr:LysM peptidoglycan-binding domain-containing protein [Kineosporiaceae bacterium]
MPRPIALTAPAAGPAKSSSPSLTEAALELFEATPAADGGKPGAPCGRIAFQFKPKELSIQKSATWERQRARGSKSAGPPQFTGAEPCKLSFELFFDASTSSSGSVVAQVEQLFSCCVPTDLSLTHTKGSPPVVILRWGTVASFVAFVTSVQAKYTLFRADGTPIRATCSVTLEEMPGEPSRQNPTSGGLATASRHTVVDGESLASIAWQEYGDPALWRPLARANDIDDPLRVRPGRTLLLPAVDLLLTEHG